MFAWVPVDVGPGLPGRAEKDTVSSDSACFPADLLKRSLACAFGVCNSVHCEEPRNSCSPLLVGPPCPSPHLRPAPLSWWGEGRKGLEHLGGRRSAQCPPRTSTCRGWRTQVSSVPCAHPPAGVCKHMLFPGLSYGF